jgi:tetratricopeptide (TPR) repeat protein
MISPCQQISPELTSSLFPSLQQALVNHEPWGEQHVAGIRDLVQRLVRRDIELGGDAVSIEAMHIFRTVWRQLRQGAYCARYERDLYATAAELAELTGWLLCDANRQLAARQVNQAALTLARASGDRSMKLFVIHNMSLQATYLRRPAEAFALVQPLLDGQLLTPRLHSMFRLRMARAYAQMGNRGDALRALNHAASLFFDGVSNHDPTWSWWVSERGLNSATAAIYGSLGDWKLAIPLLCRTLQATPGDAHRDRHLYLCVLLHAQVEVGAWREAEHTAAQLAPLIRTVGSARPLARVKATIDQLNEHPGRRRRLIAATEPVWQAINTASP